MKPSQILLWVSIVLLVVSVGSCGWGCRSVFREESDIADSGPVLVGLFTFLAALVSLFFAAIAKRIE